LLYIGYDRSAPLPALEADQKIAPPNGGAFASLTDDVHVPA
jgi:hypothetical protein